MKYRDNGAIGALLDEYEKALQELKFVIKPLTTNQISRIMDKETKDEDCVSIQSILTHVVQSGYTYSISIRNWQGENNPFREKIMCTTSKEYVRSLDQMFIYCEQVFSDHPNIQMTEKNPAQKILTRWGQRYDVEQIMAHAIVHILRHRRQIERFIARM